MPNYYTMEKPELMALLKGYEPLLRDSNLFPELFRASNTPGIREFNDLQELTSLPVKDVLLIALKCVIVHRRAPNAGLPYNQTAAVNVVEWAKAVFPNVQHDVNVWYNSTVGPRRLLSADGFPFWYQSWQEIVWDFNA